jgi:hypothetical protein
MLFTVVVILSLLWVSASTGASPAPQGTGEELRLAGAVASKISYQGRLTDSGGNPLSGSHNLKFEVWDQATGGTKLWEQTKSGVQVQNGLFTEQLDVDAGAFDGQALWLAITVNGQLLSPRQELLPAPYALTLRPQAQIRASVYDGPVLTVENTDANPAGGGYAIVAKNASGFTWRPAIYGENTGASAGVYGRSDGWHATVGWQGGSNPDNAGVYGHNEGAGPGVKGEGTMGGFFTSANDHFDIMLGGAVGRINAADSEQSDLILSANGDAIVRLDNDGGEDNVFRVKNSGGQDVFTVDESGQYTAAAGAITASVYDGPVLRVENTDPNPAGGGYAIVGKNASGFTWRPAIYGENTGASAGVYGYSEGWHGTVGWYGGDNPEHAGVFGNAAGGAAGVVGASASGDGVRGSGNTGVRGESEIDYGQGILGHGSALHTEGVVGTSDQSAGVNGIGSGTGSYSVGVYGSTNATYGLATQENVFIGGSCTGCTIVYIAQSEESSSLRAGDVVAVSGLAAPLKGHQTPVLKVRRALGSDSGLLGVVQARAAVDRADLSALSAEDRQHIMPEMPRIAAGEVASGDYLFVVVQGMAQTRVGASSGSVAVGDAVGPGAAAGSAQRLSAASSAAVLGRALEPVEEGTKLIWVLILGQ